MAATVVSAHNDPEATTLTLGTLNLVKVISPFVAITSFFLVFVCRTIYKAPPEESPPGTPTVGPGGRPLPSRRKSARRAKQCLEPCLFSTSVRTAINYLSALILVTYLGNAAIIVLQAIIYRENQWWCGQEMIIYVTAGFFVWTIIFLSLFDITPSPNIAHMTAWTAALPLELLVLGASSSLYAGLHYEPVIEDPQGGQERRSVNPWEAVEVLVIFVRFSGFLTLTLTYISVKVSRGLEQRYPTLQHSDIEATVPLIREPNGHIEANGHRYGSTDQRMQTNEQLKTKEQEPDPWAKPKEVPPVDWFQYLKGFTVFFPYIWPTKSTKLQLIALACLTIVVLQRIVNILVPWLVGRIVTSLTSDNGPSTVPWTQITLYVCLRWLQGNGGLLGTARTTLWIPVDQYAYRELSTATFQHVHGLSLDFHLSKRTGEVLSALNKGGSINTFIETIVFNLGPMVFDLVVTIIYLAAHYDAYIPLVIGIVTFFYIYITIRMAQWRQEVRRAQTDASREEFAVKNDSLVSYETVKYFNAEKYEFARYRDAVGKYQSAERRVITTLQMMNIAQHSCFMFGVVIVCFIEAFQVTQGQQTVGDFVTLITFMTQVQAPLNFFGTFFRSMQSALINSERMLELFKEQPSVVDSPTARPLPSPCGGDIRFDDVKFSYDSRKTALDGLTFRCQPGTTTALVGESGGGKSTVFRLLFRFYNPISGRICVDDHDVEDLTIDSVRQEIGVVPQDTILFNETLMYNLKYANPDATDEQVYAACRAASIHDKILAFPDGYDTKVGERGLRLSGGEKQRVAIARTILKDPRIILLDEATAALDTETEEHIQEAFRSLSSGRTMLVIAHRLSTITNAEQILVVSGGKVIESGRHEELIQLNGKYASMWRKQIRAQRAAVEAEELRQRAEAIMEAGGVDSQSHSEDESNKNSSSTETEENSNSKPKGKPKKTKFLKVEDAADRGR